MRFAKPAIIAAVALTALSFAPHARADAASDAKRAAEVPKLRETRTQLQSIVTMMDTDVADPKGYRHKAIADIKQAIGELNAEIGEFAHDK